MAPHRILTKYSNYADIFYFNLAMNLLENTKINRYIIELIDSKKIFYEPIYTLSLVNFETLKIYIKNHLKIGYI